MGDKEGCIMIMYHLKPEPRTDIRTERLSLIAEPGGQTLLHDVVSNEGETTISEFSCSEAQALLAQRRFEEIVVTSGLTWRKTQVFTRIRL